MLPEAAVAQGAPRLHDGVGSAVHVALRAVNQRLIAAPIECRGYVGVWEGGRWTLHAAAGKPHPIRRTLARFVFGVSEDQIRVLVGDVGGGFGAKNVLYAEAALVLSAAKRLGRPVRWQATCKGATTPAMPPWRSMRRTGLPPCASQRWPISAPGSVRGR